MRKWILCAALLAIMAGACAVAAWADVVYWRVDNVAACPYGAGTCAKGSLFPGSAWTPADLDAYWHMSYIMPMGVDGG